MVKFSEKGYTFEKKCPWNSEGYCEYAKNIYDKIRRRRVKKSCYNNFGSKMLVGASKSAKRLG